MAVRRFALTVTTAADGTATAYTPYVSGKIAAIHYVKPGSGNYTDGVDFTITAETTGETIWTESNVNASKACYPRAPTFSNAGVAALYAAGGAAVNDLIRISRDRVKIVLASGGDTKAGTFYVIVED
jgi:hypothetical protein